MIFRDLPKSVRVSLLLTVLLSLLLGTGGGIAVGLTVGLLGPSAATGWLARQFPSLSGRNWFQRWQQLAQENQVRQLQAVSVQEESSTIDVVKRAAPSVVSVIVSKDLSKLYRQRQSSPFDQFFNDPFFNPFGLRFQQPEATPPPSGKQQVGGGTGFAVDQGRGWILTNNHVVSDDQAEYTVLTNDGKERPAKVLTVDPLNDLAILQIDDHDLPALSLGNSDDLQIGQTVIAIGNALGEFRNTVTKGVISGIGRNIEAASGAGQSEQLTGVIQTDAAINPGNSGGPLLNALGQVVGINTAVSREGQLIGFAIPVNEAKRMLDSVRQYGKVRRSYLGVRYRAVTPALARQNSLPVDYGALISSGASRDELAVVPGSPADKAGLTENDIILAVNGQKLENGQALASILAKFPPGTAVTLRTLHRGVEVDRTVTLGEFPEGSGR